MILESQLGASLPKPVKQDRPDLTDVLEWSDQLADKALKCVECDKRIWGTIKRPTAVAVQQALIVKLVVGSDAPPIRLSILRTARHQTYVESACMQPDCVLPACKGNRFELLEEASTTDGASTTTG